MTARLQASQSDFFETCCQNDSNSRKTGVREEGQLKTRSKKDMGFVAANREEGYGPVSVSTKQVPQRQRQALPGRDPVRDPVPGFKIPPKKPVDKAAAAAKAGGGMQPPSAATKAGGEIQPPSAIVHFPPSPITRCCCGTCTQDASGSEHFCSVPGKRCFATCFCWTPMCI